MKGRTADEKPPFFFLPFQCSTGNNTLFFYRINTSRPTADHHASGIDKNLSIVYFYYENGEYRTKPHKARETITGGGSCVFGAFYGLFWGIVHCVQVYPLSIVHFVYAL